MVENNRCCNRKISCNVSVVLQNDSDIRLSGHVSWVGRSSVEIVVWLEQNIQGQWRKLTRALFLMAARNATNTAAAMVNPLTPANEEERKILHGGESAIIFRIKFFVDIFFILKTKFDF